MPLSIFESHLWQLLCNVSSNEHSLQVDPEVLHNQPLFDDLSGIGEFLHPQLDFLLEGSIVPIMQVRFIFMIVKRKLSVFGAQKYHLL